MTTDWIAMPGSPTLEEKSEPYLVRASESGHLRQFLSSAGASVVDVDLGDSTSLVDVVGVLREGLEFPSWCGSGWDAVHDAFPELRAAWPLPLAIVVAGLPKLMAAKPHLALNTVLGLSRLCEEFSIAGDQVLVFYVGDRWDD
ncbi:barstar family protein [Demequina lutea]|uniref:Barstar (barnase inhibitor) domain-containing protein n=1 Tax=Demequina lutea TaxID=431489 RepID=A0A7Y9ZAL4_9MICO|nr:hypothetical protein [Demequina lutea]NYI41874.1 hypothetical protein [Demequina lutea]